MIKDPKTSFFAEDFIAASLVVCEHRIECTLQTMGAQDRILCIQKVLIMYHMSISNFPKEAPPLYLPHFADPCIIAGFSDPVWSVRTE